MLLRSIIELREVWCVSNDRKASSDKRWIVLFKVQSAYIVLSELKLNELKHRLKSVYLT